MCDLCLHTPCVSGCPNKPDPIPILKCENCNMELFDGDVYYPELGVCQYCVEDFEEEVFLTDRFYDEGLDEYI